MQNRWLHCHRTAADERGASRGDSFPHTGDTLGSACRKLVGNTGVLTPYFLLRDDGTLQQAGESRAGDIRCCVQVLGQRSGRVRRPQGLSKQQAFIIALSACLDTSLTHLPAAHLSLSINNSCPQTCVLAPLPWRAARAAEVKPFVFG